jgi:hypothetical protein
MTRKERHSIPLFGNLFKATNPQGAHRWFVEWPVKQRVTRSVVGCSVIRPNQEGPNGQYALNDLEIGDKKSDLLCIHH